MLFYSRNIVIGICYWAFFFPIRRNIICVIIFLICMCIFPEPNFKQFWSVKNSCGMSYQLSISVCIVSNAHLYTGQCWWDDFTRQRLIPQQPGQHVLYQHVDHRHCQAYKLLTWCFHSHESSVVGFWLVSSSVLCGNCAIHHREHHWLYLAIVVHSSTANSKAAWLFGLLL